MYSNFGIDLPRTSYEQEYAGYEVSYSDAQPGDLICYGSHVAIYMGDGQIVHASNSRDGIKINEEEADIVARENKEHILDFYKRFVQKLRDMMAAGKAAGCKLISVCGP